MKQKYMIVDADLTAISQAVQEVDETLQTWKTDTKERVQSLLMLEELMVTLAEKATEGEKIHVRLRKTLRSTRIRLTCRGEKLSLQGSVLSAEEIDACEEYGPDVVDAIRNLILQAAPDKTVAKYKGGVNTVVLCVHESDKAMLYDALIALAASIVVALVLRLTLPMNIVSLINDNLFSPVYTMFIRAVQIIMAPLVFFSIATSICGLSDLSGVGRTGGKIMGCYCLTTMLGILIAIGVNAFIQPASFGEIILPSASAAIEAPNVNPSLVNTIVNLIPNNFFGAFVQNDMLQVIVLALLTGAACGKMGKYSSSLRYGVEVMNSLFGNITALVIKSLPIAIFASMASMVTTIDLSTIGTLGMWLSSYIIACLCMVVVYMTLLLVFGRINPLFFLRKYSNAMVTALSSCSSNATMPVSFECCKKLGISPRIYSFSIPLGATVNMDGSSILFMGSALFLSALYGVNIDASAMFSLIFTVMLLSMACPGVPGAGTACLLIVISQIGVPAESIALLLGILPLCDLVCTTVNVTGDGAVTTLVAKTEKQLDLTQYRS